MANKANLKAWLVISMFLAAVLPCVFCSVAIGQPWDGSGVEGDPYLIWDANQMNTIGANPGYWDRHFKLMADIDLSDFNGLGGNPTFNIIGTFTGVFHGNEHEILNFTYNCTSATYDRGLFRTVTGPEAEIKNLGLIAPDVNARECIHVGSLIGRLANANITKCYVEGGSVTGLSCVGGLIGLVEGNSVMSTCHSACNVVGTYTAGGLVGLVNDAAISVSQCYSSSSVWGEDTVGGLVAANFGAPISECYSSGSVRASIGTASGAGGLLGYSGTGTISNCYSTASVLGGSTEAGGLVGWLNSGIVLRCYSTGSVSGDSLVGGLVGGDNGGRGTVVDSFWDVETTGQLTSAGGTGGTGKITSEMQIESTFTDAGWDFNTPIWKFCSVPDYPKLWWEECLEPAILANVEIKPETLNLQSKGRWIMGIIRLPEDYNVAEIEPNSVLLEDEVEAERVWLTDEFAVVKFSRSEVQEMLGEVETPGEVELVVSGELSDGTVFEGTDTIRVIDVGGGKNIDPPGKALKQLNRNRKRIKGP